MKTSPQLLGLDARFAPIEPQVRDPFYVGAMIFMFNSAAANPAILPLLPGFAEAHYNVLRDLHPSLLPPLFGRVQLVEAAPRVETTALAEACEQVGWAVALLRTGDHVALSRTLPQLRRLLRQTAALEPTSRAFASFLLSYSKALVHLLRFRMRPVVPNPAALLRLTYELQLFSPAAALAPLIAELRLAARVEVARTDPGHLAAVARAAELLHLPLAPITLLASSLPLTAPNPLPLTKLAAEVNFPPSSVEKPLQASPFGTQVVAADT